MKKLMIKGMALLSLGMVFVACSHEGATYDEKTRVITKADGEKIELYPKEWIKYDKNVDLNHFF